MRLNQSAHERPTINNNIIININNNNNTNMMPSDKRRSPSMQSDRGVSSTRMRDLQ